MNTNETRAQHVQWCKERALALLYQHGRGYVTQGDLDEAFASMASDLGKHPETEGHIGISLGLQMMMAGHLSTQAKMEEFIRGFN